MDFPGYEGDELLELVKKAIKEILTTGQSYKIGSRSLTRADIGELRKLKAELEAQTDETSDAFGFISLSKHCRR